MNTAFYLQPKDTDWKILYRSAIQETNESIVPQRVSEAEEAVLARTRDFYGSSNPEEMKALEDAVCALRAFKTAWQQTKATSLHTRRAKGDGTGGRPHEKETCPDRSRRDLTR